MKSVRLSEFELDFLRLWRLKRRELRKRSELIYRIHKLCDALENKDIALTAHAVPCPWQSCAYCTRPIIRTAIETGLLP